MPALESTQPDLVVIMKTGESDDPRRHFLGRYALVAVQIAGTMILLVLTIQGRRNFHDLMTSNIGFHRDHRMTMRFNPTAAGYSPAQTEKFYERLVERTSEMTGIRSAAMTSSLPMTYDPDRREIAPEHYDFPPGKETARVMTYTVDEHYFDTLGVPMLAGRGFRAGDREDTPRVVVVNQAFANEFMPGNPIGRRLKIGNAFRGTEIIAEVVGVVMTGKMFLLTEPPTQAIYLPMRQNFRERMTLVAETVGDPGAMAGPLQAMAHSIDPNMPVYRMRTMEDIFNQSSVATIQMILRIYDFASLMGLILALVGLYAVVAYQVARKTKEIGIRVALGAERLQVVKLFLRQAVWISVAGIMTGLTLSGFANRLSASTLGSASLNPLLVTVVAVSLLVATMMAALIPARRASRIDPQQALRQD
jgi:predicted permease